jgi:oxygen-independent coproporphyrinogen III oxidase
VQSFDPTVQRAINREQSFEQTAAATRGLRQAGVAGINFDLIYGLPHQTVASCLDTVNRCVELRPGRFSVFGYAHVPSFKKYQRRIDEAWLPDSLERHEQSAAIEQALETAGYQRIGLDHFALPKDELAVAQRERRLRRNFQGYTTDASDLLLGLGASAIGQLPQGFVQNEVQIKSYSEAVAAGRFATARVTRWPMTTGCAPKSSSASCAIFPPTSRRSASGTALLRKRSSRPRRGCRSWRPTASSRSTAPRLRCEAIPAS